MLPHIFTRKRYLALVAIFLVFLGCSDSTGGSTSVQTSGIQPEISTEVQAVDGSTISVSDFNGVPTAMWFWSPN